MTTPDPLLATARNDHSSGRTMLITSQDLLAVDTEANTCFDATDTHAITDTFWSGWQLQDLTAKERDQAVAVMRGVEKEPAHPAYRVSTTGTDGIRQCQAGARLIMTFMQDPQKATHATIWLTTHATT